MSNPPTPLLSAAQQSTFDSLDAAAAILDGGGTIRTVNRAWIEFADANGLGDPDYGVGERYDHWNDGDEFARRTADGLRAVLAGELVSYSLVYPCHSPDAERWFRLVVARALQAGEVRVLTMHRRLIDPTSETQLVESATATSLSVFGATSVCAWCDPRSQTINPTVNLSHGICGSCFDQLDLVRTR